MSKERIYELIRKESVVLWAGAGLSMELGYPSGAELSKILYNDLTTEERAGISEDLLLPEMAEKYIQKCLGKRNRLNQLLIKTYIEKKHKSFQVYDLIAKIPHLHSIITTNYDKLFERAYKHNKIEYNTVTSVPKLSYINDKLPTIYRIHGDLEESLDDIIISSSDYNKYTLENSLYKNVIASLFATKNILFIGYNLSDPNVNAIFDRVINDLGPHAKEVFLVAPRLKPERKKELEAKGIIYIDAKARNFIKGLYKDILNNIKYDFAKGDVSYETNRKFYTLHGLNITVSSKDNKLTLDNISSTSGKPLYGQLNLTLTAEGAKQLTSFLHGESTGPIILGPSNMIDLKETIQGITNTTYEQCKKIIIAKKPIHQYVDIIIDDFRLQDIVMEMIGYRNEIQQTYKLDCGYLILKISKPEVINGESTSIVNLHVKHYQKFENISKELDFFQLLYYMTVGKKFITVYRETSESFEGKLSGKSDLENPFLYFLNYFKALKEIEDFYNIRFKKFGDPTEQDYDLINQLIQYIHGKKLEIEQKDAISISVADFDENQLIELENSKEPIIYQYYDDTIKNLFGNPIKFPFTILEFIKPIVLNGKELINKKNEMVKLKVKSLNNKILIWYSKTPVIYAPLVKK